VAREALAQGWFAYAGDPRELAIGLAFAAVPEAADRWQIVEVGLLLSHARDRLALEASAA
jgi:hypothetical protein